MTSKKKKNRRATFTIKIKKQLSQKAKDDALFKIRSKRPVFLLKLLKNIPNPVVYSISLQQLEYEMECADIPDD